MDEISKSSEKVYNELKKYTFEKQLDILRDCGLSNIVDSHTLIPSNKDFKIKLDTVVDMIKGENGNKIKYASWNGIRESILKALKSIDIKPQNPPEWMKMDKMKVYLILDKLFIINSFIAFFIFLITFVEFFGFIETTNRIKGYMIIILIAFLIESFLRRIRHIENFKFYENKHITNY